VECQIVANGRGKRLEEVLGKHAFAWVKLDVAVKDKTSIAYDRNRATVNLAALHVILVEVLVIVGIEAAARYLVKAYYISLFDETRLGWICVAHEEFGHSDSPSCQERTVRTEFGEAERFACLARAKLDQMVVALYQGNHTHQIKQLDALRNPGMGWLVAHRANQRIDPLVACKLFTPGEILCQVNMTDLDGV